MRTSSRLLLLTTALALLAPAVGAIADTGTDLPGIDVVAPDTDADEPETVASEDGHDIRVAVAATGAPTPEVLLRGSGWGHGVGMSQYGAYGKARDGETFREILGYYYQGTAFGSSTDFDGIDTATQPIRVGLTQNRASTEVGLLSAGDEVHWQICTDTCEDEATQQGPGTWRATAREDGGILVERPRQEGDEWVQVFTTTHDKIRIRQPDHTPIRVAAAGLAGDRLYARGWHEIINTKQDAADKSQLSTVQRVPDMEQYLYGLGEVPSSWGTDANGGFAALQAQAVTARTFAIGKILWPRGLNGDCRCHLLVGPADQAYSGWTKEIEGGGALGDIWKDSVDSTERVTMSYEGRLAATFYSSSHGGRSENVEDSWAYGSTPIDYLRSVDDPWSQRPGLGNRYRAWTATSSNANMAAELSRGLDGTMEVVEQITIRNRTEGGTPRELAVRGRAGDGSEVTGTFTRGTSDTTRKHIAGGNLRRDLSGLTVDDVNDDRVWLTGLPSSQIQTIGFGPFTDDQGSVHEYATVWANEAGIAQGRSATQFNPGGAVTRAQMAAFLYRTFDIPPPTGDHFDDVGTDNPHHEAINALAEAGVAHGYDDDTFQPGSGVTRAQMASFLRRALGLEEVQPDGRFDDVEDGPHAGAIHAIADAGVTQGCTATSFCPQSSVARGQMATFLYRVVEDAR